MTLLNVLNGGVQRGYLQGRELATDFKHPQTGKPYNPDFATMARPAGVEGVRVDRAADVGDAIRVGMAVNRPYLIDVKTSRPTSIRAARASGNCPASAASADGTGSADAMHDTHINHKGTTKRE